MNALPSKSYEPLLSDMSKGYIEVEGLRVYMTEAISLQERRVEGGTPYAKTLDEQWDVFEFRCGKSFNPDRFLGQVLHKEACEHDYPDIFSAISTWLEIEYHGGYYFDFVLQVPLYAKIAPLAGKKPAILITGHPRVKGLILRINVLDTRTGMIRLTDSRPVRWSKPQARPRDTVSTFTSTLDLASLDERYDHVTLSLEPVGERTFSATRWGGRIADLIGEGTRVSCDEHRKSVKHDAELARKLDEFLSRLSPGQFEEWATSFIDAVQSSQAMYQGRLKKDNPSLVRHIGGSGSEDSFSEPKLEYLEPLLDGRSTHEAKRYLKDRLRLRDLKDFLSRCQLRKTDGILITSASKVDSTVWAWLRQLRSTNGRWRYIVIDRPLLAELLSEFDLVGLIE